MIPLNRERYSIPPFALYLVLKTMSRETFSAVIDAEHAGQRIDQTLAKMYPEWSRARLQQWIKSGAVLVDGESWRPRDRVVGGESLRMTIELADEVEDFKPEPMPLPVVYEDEQLIVIDKPAGRVVHPAPGHWSGTLLNGLLHRYPELRGVPRAGIVHRLDKDTSGLMAVARSLEAHRQLVEALQRREFRREYLALVEGVPVAGGTVDEPIGRHHQDRKRMAVTESGKPAVTHYRIRQRFPAHTLLDVKLETGRTHQIRVHMAHLRYPIVGDPVYGGRPRLPKGMAPEVVAALQGFRRQALHAARLGLAHPGTGAWMSWEAPLPDDFAALLAVLDQAG